ncbi:hypothetical protein ACFLTP_04570 [Chloroflexota bacterium]
MNVIDVVNGRRRIACYNRSKGWECPQTSAYLYIYEYRIRVYLSSFHVPADYQVQTLNARQQLQNAYDDSPSQRARL